MANLEELKANVERLHFEVAHAMEKVTRAALFHAAQAFAMEAEDPGWEAEMHEEMLRDAVKECAAAMNLHAEAQKALTKAASAITE